MKITCAKSNKGTAKLNIESKGNDFGAMYGIVNEAKNNNARMLFIKNNSLFKNDKFFKRGIVLNYFLPALNR